MCVGGGCDGCRAALGLSSPSALSPSGRARARPCGGDGHLKLGSLPTGCLTAFSSPPGPLGVSAQGRAGQLLSHVCLVGSKLLPLVDFDRLIGCETCLPVKLRQAPERFCWHPLLSESGLCPNTQCPFLMCQTPCFSDLLSLFIAFNWIDESHLRLLNE